MKINLNANAIILSGGKGSRLGYKEKGLLFFNSEALIYRKVRLFNKLFQNVIVVTNLPEKYTSISSQISLIKDDKEYLGPLMGLYCGLKGSTTDINFISAVDMPFISSELLNYFYSFTSEYEIVIGCKNQKAIPAKAGIQIEHMDPRFRGDDNSLVCGDDNFLASSLRGDDKKFEPLFGFYSKKIAYKIEEILKQEDKRKRSLAALIVQSKTKIISDKEIKKYDPNLLSFVNINTQEDLNKWETYDKTSNSLK